MRVALVGSDYEENLGVAMIAAALVQAKHRVDVVAFNEVNELDDVVGRILARRPALVGLAVQFQHRAWEFLLLSRKLRSAGFQGHITCGGHWPTLASAELLTHEAAVDSVVLHEGESTIVELAAALAQRDGLGRVPGLALRDAHGGPYRTAPRRLVDDLDTLPFALRYRPPTRQLGIPFIPMYGSRGCWGACAFCSITTYYRDARAYGGARKVRLRSPQNIAAEMATLWHHVGGPCTFCFHDDTFLLPRPNDTLERVRALRHALDEFGVRKVGLIGKAHPECVTPELARELSRLGVIRMFLGVENVSQPGQDHLNRRTRTEDIERAITAFDDAGIFVCYNLLVFEPDAELDDVRENLAFMRAHAHIPVNFCRAEPYHGTPLHLKMRERRALNGSYLGWDYRLRSDRTELLFRIATTAFHDRNFDPRGLANRYMGLGYQTQLLRCFYDCSSARGQVLLDRSRSLIGDITHDTADLLDEALRLAEACDLGDHDRIERETALLGLRVAAHDRVLHARLDELTADIEAHAAEQPPQRRRARGSKQLRDMLQGLTIAGAVAATASSCGGTTQSSGTATADAGAAGEDGTDGWGGGLGVGGGNSAGGLQGYGGETAAFGGAFGLGGYGVGGEGVGGDPYFGDGGYWYGDSGGTYPNYGGWVGDSGGTSSYGGGDGVGGFYGVGGQEGVGGDPGYGGYGGSGGDSAAGDTGLGGWTSDGGSAGEADFVAGYWGLAGAEAGGGGGADSGGGTAGGHFAGAGAAGRGGNGGDTAGSSGAGGGGASGVSGLGAEDPPPAPGGIEPPSAELSVDRRTTLEHWADTSPRRAIRTQDLPLWDPPGIRLESRTDGDAVRVRLCGERQNMSLRWESNGDVEGDGREVTWRPASSDDQLRVAVRTRGGVAITALRARQVEGG